MNRGCANVCKVCDDFGAESAPATRPGGQSTCTYVGIAREVPTCMCVLYGSAKPSSRCACVLEYCAWRDVYFCES